MKRAVPFQRPLSALLVLLVSVCVGLGWGSRARADDLADFEAARSLYETQAYARAVDAFRLLVGSDPPRLTDPLLVLESRKYLAASLLFMGAEAESRSQLRLLLRQEPNYALDPLAFPTDVYAQFEQVKRELRDELEARKKAEEAARRAAEEAKQRAQEERARNLTRLRLLATTEELHEKNSRWIASMPLGLGQFQNGDKGLGVALAMAESLAVATSVTSYVVHQHLSDATLSPNSLDEARRVESTWRSVNIVSFSIFAALAVIGIIDAHVRFVPERVTRRARPLPPDLERWMREQSLSRGAPVLRF